MNQDSLINQYNILASDPYGHEVMWDFCLDHNIFNGNNFVHDCWPIYDEYKGQSKGGDLGMTLSSSNGGSMGSWRSFRLAYSHSAPQESRMNRRSYVMSCEGSNLSDW